MRKRYYTLLTLLAAASLTAGVMGCAKNKPEKPEENIVESSEDHDESDEVDIPAEDDEFADEDIYTSESLEDYSLRLDGKKAVPVKVWKEDEETKGFLNYEYGSEEIAEEIGDDVDLDNYRTVGSYANGIQITWMLTETEDAEDVRETLQAMTTQGEQEVSEIEYSRYDEKEDKAWALIHYKDVDQDTAYYVVIQNLPDSTQLIGEVIYDLENGQADIVPDAKYIEMVKNGIMLGADEGKELKLS